MRSFIEVIVCLLLTCQAQANDYSVLPEKAQPYAQLVVDVSINPSREMALTEQESGWNQFAESPFAKGLRQFTDSTGEWASLTFCKDLGPYDPFNPEWSLKCGIRYAERLQRNNDYGSYCNNRKVAESEYNGGAWVVWELKTANSSNLAEAERVCGTKLFNGRKRAGWACKENYNYPRHIDRRQHKYLSIGGVNCG